MSLLSNILAKKHMKRKTKESSPSDDKSSKVASIETTPTRGPSEPAQKRLKAVSTDEDVPAPQEVATPSKASEISIKDEDNEDEKEIKPIATEVRYVQIVSVNAVDIGIYVNLTK